MPWKRLDYNARRTFRILASYLHLEGYPTLALFRVGDGAKGIITMEGEEALFSFDFNDLDAFEEQKEARDKELQSWPESYNIPSLHSHPLKKMKSVYYGSYSCDVCRNTGEGWVYHCDECGWDAHPECAKTASEKEASGEGASEDANNN
jgi:nucleoredoxin